MKTTLKSIFTNHKLIGWLLLAVSFGIGVLTIYWGNFVDEADNLVVGDLIRQGATLYSGIFSHHFPFPYYWMALVIAIFGKSIFWARFSVLMFQIAAFAIAMSLSGKHLLVGLTALMWGIIRPFYLGHMVLYFSFAGVSLFAILLTVMPILEGTVIPNWKHWLVIAIFSVIAFLSTPLSAYAVAVALAFLFIKKPSWGIIPGAIIAGGLAIYFGALLVTNTFQVFWKDAILFNIQVYAKYTGAETVPITDLFPLIGLGLGIPYGHWFDINPFKPILQIGYAQIDSWLFTGFLFRLAIMVATLFMLLRKKFSAGLFLYLFAAATLLIAKVNFRSQAFILVALFALAVIIGNEFPWSAPKPFLNIGYKALRIVVILLAFWLGIRLTGQIFTERQNLSYDKNFKGFEKEAAQLQKFSCDQPDVLLAPYPAKIYTYWFTGFNPVSKYVFMWPWVAEVGQTEMINDLGGQKLVIVYVNDEIVWDYYRPQEFLRPLINYLEANYHKVAKKTYVSPALFALCPQ